jgi:multicomponent Na+:H+ antiporter subunit F
MNVWTIAAFILLVALAPCGWVCLRGSPNCPEEDIMVRLMGLETAGTVDVLLLLVLAERSHRSPFFDLALMLALLTFAAGLVFARFLERWL